MPRLEQTVVIYGRRCTQRAAGQSYIVRDARGKVLARAMTRLLAVARAARAVLA
jgi:hypothetical protein